MLPLMQREVVDRHAWLTDGDFLDSVALAQSLPGVFAVNMAALTGYRLRGVWGAFAAIIGNVLMPIVFILLLAVFFNSLRDNPVVSRIFMGVRPAVVALIAAPVSGMARHADIRWSNAWIPVATALLVWMLGVNPIAVVLVAALLGLLWNVLFGKKTD